MSLTRFFDMEMIIKAKLAAACYASNHPSIEEKEPWITDCTGKKCSDCFKEYTEEHLELILIEKKIFQESCSHTRECFKDFCSPTAGHYQCNDCTERLYKLVRKNPLKQALKERRK